MPLYHATLDKYKLNILKKGLTPHPENSLWGSNKYLKILDKYPIFLSNDKNIAISIIYEAIHNHNIKNKHIALFKIDKINTTKLFVDPFYHSFFAKENIEDINDTNNQNVYCFAYIDSITPKNLELIE